MTRLVESDKPSVPVVPSPPRPLPEFYTDLSRTSLTPRDHTEPPDFVKCPTMKKTLYRKCPPLGLIIRVTKVYPSNLFCLSETEAFEPATPRYTYTV